MKPSASSLASFSVRVCVINMWAPSVFLRLPRNLFKCVCVGLWGQFLWTIFLINQERECQPILCTVKCFIRRWKSLTGDKLQLRSCAKAPLLLNVFVDLCMCGFLFSIFTCWAHSSLCSYTSWEDAWGGVCGRKCRSFMMTVTRWKLFFLWLNSIFWRG